MKRVRNLVVIGLFCIRAGGAAVGSGSQHWLCWDAGGVPTLDVRRAPASPAVAMRSSGLAGFDVTARTPGLSVETVVNEGGTFVKLGWPDAPQAGAVGAPAIPVVRRLFVAPADAELAVSYDAGAPVLIDSATVGTSLRLLPVQPPAPIVRGATAQFKYDPAAYALDLKLPAERAAILEVGIVRGQRVCLLEIRPVAYNPAQQQVFVYPQIEVRVDFIGPGYVPDTLSVLPGLRSIVLNPDLLPAAGLRGEGNYLIIVANQFEDAIASFTDAKTTQGYTVSTYVVPDDADQYQIKSYIMGLWNGPDAPAYILLVGDTNTIPCWVGIAEDYAPTDLYYACMNGPYQSAAKVALTARTRYARLPAELEISGHGGRGHGAGSAGVGAAGGFLGAHHGPAPVAGASFLRAAQRSIGGGGLRPLL